MFAEKDVSAPSIVHLPETLPSNTAARLVPVKLNLTYGSCQFASALVVSSSFLTNCHLPK
ncbi:hypothetical protein [Qingrenia yutianensis]|uniref:hypothetical protein n=1 Tax=Qingrenia yutianensis TaxID=2763676 RepID=UPI00223C2C79|nr:hypothetical protein [Qingrenia yutianensis]